MYVCIYLYALLMSLTQLETGNQVPDAYQSIFMDLCIYVCICPAHVDEARDWQSGA
jgi:hypothetical protein